MDKDVGSFGIKRAQDLLPSSLLPLLQGMFVFRCREHFQITNLFCTYHRREMWYDRRSSGFRIEFFSNFSDPEKYVSRDADSLCC